jgi:hypothetical protein
MLDNRTLLRRKGFDKSADWLSLAECGISIKQKVKSLVGG